MATQEIEKIRIELELYYNKIYDLETDLEIMEEDYNFMKFVDRLPPNEKEVAKIAREYYQKYPKWRPDELLQKYKNDKKKETQNALRQKLKSRHRK